MIQDAHWPKILQFLRSCPGIYVGQETKCRRFLEAVLWITRSGAQWRLLPTEYGNWNSVYKRFARWCDKGIWELMHQHFADEPDMEYLILDSTVVRAHPCAAGALHTSGGQEAQALGRSRGGFSTKIHVNVDALGNPVDGKGPIEAKETAPIEKIAPGVIERKSVVYLCISASGTCAVTTERPLSVSIPCLTMTSFKKDR